MTTKELIEFLDPKFERLEQKIDMTISLQQKTNGRVTTLEGKVTDLEKANINHIISCPQTTRITKLEEESVKNRATKAFVLKTVGIASALFSIAWIIFQMIVKGD